MSTTHRTFAAAFAAVMAATLAIALLAGTSIAQAQEIDTANELKLSQRLDSAFAAGTTEVKYSDLGIESGRAEEIGFLEYFYGPYGFCVQHCSSDEDTGMITVYYKSDAAKTRKAVRAGLDEALSWAATAKGPIEKAKAVHDYLKRNCKYASKGTAEYIFNAYGAFGKKKCVCQGYVAAFKMAMDELGITCDIASSDNTMAGGHAWNRIKVSGKWYNVDATVDDPMPDRGMNGQMFSNAFMKSDKVLKKLGKKDGFDGYDYGMYGFYYNSKCTSTKYDSKTKWNKYPKIKKGLKFKASGAMYQLLSTSTCKLIAAPAGKTSFTLPATAKCMGKKMKVAGIDSGAFKDSKVTTLTIKTTKLTKKSVKGSLKGGKVTKIKAPGSKKKAYKKAFAAGNSGAAVSVK